MFNFTLGRDGHFSKLFYIQLQHTKKVMSDSPRLVDFAVGLVDFILDLPDRQVKILGH